MLAGEMDDHTGIFSYQCDVIEFLVHMVRVKVWTRRWTMRTRRELQEASAGSTGAIYSLRPWQIVAHDFRRVGEGTMNHKMYMRTMTYVAAVAKWPNPTRRVRRRLQG